MFDISIDRDSLVSVLYNTTYNNKADKSIKNVTRIKRIMMYSKKIYYK